MGIFTDISRVRKKPESRSNLRRLWKWGRYILCLLLLILGAGAWYEIKTSYLQSRFLSKYAAKLSYTIKPSPSSDILFPTDGPFNKQRGYTRIPMFQRILKEQNYHVTEQAHFSPELMKIAKHGVTPPYQESPVVGFVMRDANGTPIYDALARRKRVFEKFEDIPPLIINAILFIEDRDLKDPSLPTVNPVINWNRFAKAGFLYGASKVGLPVKIEGGSTLATQLEKYRYSPNGNTASVADKFRQMTSASLKVYKEGTDTRQMRRSIIIDYLNTIPLSAVPGYGEIYGIGEGFYAWFNTELKDVCLALFSPETDLEKVRRFKEALTLLCAVRAPTYYLIQNYPALEKRVSDYINLLAVSRIIDTNFAYLLHNTNITPLSHQDTTISASAAMYKAINAIRTDLIQDLKIPDYYELDRLNLEIETTLNTPLQREIATLLKNLKSDDFLNEHSMKSERLLGNGEPDKMIYSFMLFERTPYGNALRVHADNFKEAFDINRGMKLILGSTAKLRTLVHYLEIIESLYQQYSILPPEVIKKFYWEAKDPLREWVARKLYENREITVEELLDQALERSYSANPNETFFTGGGIHKFENFRSSDDNKIITVREATIRSVNLVFIRLMRDLVKFHKAGLPYDADAVMKNQNDPQRRWLLEEIADNEAKAYLGRFYRRYKKLSSSEEIIKRLFKARHNSSRHLAILFFASHPSASEAEMVQWLEKWKGTISSAEAGRLFRAYGNPRLTLADYGFLLKKHPLNLWCAVKMIQEPGISWEKVLKQSEDARRISSAWLLKPKMRKPQDIRLRIRIEKDAFERMTVYWRRVGFPFKKLIASYSTAIGSSCDQPAALAKLTGIILNEGILYPDVSVLKMRFAQNTPYHTTFERIKPRGKRVMAASVAKELQEMLRLVVEEGTARRVKGVFVKADETPVTVGGKTGTGDNRFKKFSRDGKLISSKALNRTATFTFYIGDRYFGAITAFVSGSESDNYSFTSSLPVAILKLLSPAIQPYVI